MRLILHLLLVILPAVLYGQEIVSVPDAKFITKFPFRLYTGGVIVVKAHFPLAADSLNFIVDTGGGGVSLDSSTCKEFGIATQQTDTVVTGIGGRKKVDYVFNQSLSFPGLKIPNLNFHVVDYDILTSTYGEKIDGILGYSFFSRYLVKINFDSLHIEVFTPGKLDYPDGGITLHPIITSLPIQRASVKDNRKLTHYFYLDTGAGLSFLMNEKFAKDSAILRTKRKPLITQAEGIAGKLQMRLTVVREVKLGSYRFYRVPTYLYDDIYNVTQYPFCGGLIGNDLLRRFNLIFNYRQREVHLLPNSHFNDSFDYSYTGLSMYYIDGNIIVLDVIKGSPADKAGFKVDDIVIGVDTNLSGNLQAYKTAMQNVGAKIKVLIKRNDKLGELVLNPIRIY